PRETFGRDVLLSGDPSGEGGEPEERGRHAKPLKDFIAEFPISDESRQQLLALYEGRRDPLAGKSVEEKRKILKSTSYRDYLTKICGCSEEVANCFQGRTLGYFGLGADSVAASDARELGYPGFKGLKIERANPEWDEPYIYHFPDGNASLARLLVRKLMPEVVRYNPLGEAGRDGRAPSRAPARIDAMDSIVSDRFDYSQLDVADARTRIRLDSTVLDVRNSGDKVLVGYSRDGT